MTRNGDTVVQNGDAPVRNGDTVVAAGKENNGIGPKGIGVRLTNELLFDLD